jgi:hypothetical protein
VRSGVSPPGLGQAFAKTMRPGWRSATWRRRVSTSSPTGECGGTIEAAQPNLDLSVLDGLSRHTIVLGVVDLADPEPDAPGIVAKRIEAALEHVPVERLVLAPDCGMKYLPRTLARQKLDSLVAGAELVRSRL